MKNRIKILALSLISVIILACFSGCATFTPPSKGGNTNLPSSVVQSQNVKFNDDQTEGVLSLVEAVKKVERSVIAIQMQEKGQVVSSGSGVIVDANSGKQSDDEDVYYILTCHHVISGMGEIVIFVPDNNCRNIGDSDYDQNYAFSGKIGNAIYDEYPLTFVGGDKESDVAVLRLDVEGRKDKDGNPVDIVSAKVVTDDEYEVSRGESVFAIGNPTGELPGSVTAGTIAYINREIYLDEVGYATCYQLNVDIYHGSSGGGLFNMYGQLIGLTNAGSDEFSGINYAIPYTINDTAKDMGFVNIATQLIGTATETNYGYISGRWNIGVSINTTGTDGISIIEVIANSNAENAGVKANDVIKEISYKVNGLKTTRAITNMSSFTLAVNDMKRYLSLGDEFEMTVNRPSGFRYESKTFTIKLENQYIFCDTNS